MIHQRNEEREVERKEENQKNIKLKREKRKRKLKERKGKLKSVPKIFGIDNTEDYIEDCPVNCINFQ
jgi:hypothetical protein